MITSQPFSGLTQAPDMGWRGLRASNSAGIGKGTTGKVVLGRPSARKLKESKWRNSFPGTLNEVNKEA